jgi:formylmethanofuran dehydrogenase subunit E
MQFKPLTECSLGKRTLKFFDYGKMAATFINLETQKAVRIVARDDARTLAAAYCPKAAGPREAQKKAYGIMPEVVPFALWLCQRTSPPFRIRLLSLLWIKYCAT